MRRLLLDTHIWIWYCAGSENLSQPLREVIEASTGSCWLSPISLWETSVLIQKGRLKTKEGPDSWIRNALDTFPLREAAVNFEVARQVGNLDLPHGDPGDRFLVATAKVYDLTLVTVDRHLRELDEVDVLSS